MNKWLTITLSSKTQKYQHFIQQLNGLMWMILAYRRLDITDVISRILISSLYLTTIILPFNRNSVRDRICYNELKSKYQIHTYIFLEYTVVFYYEVFCSTIKTYRFGVFYLFMNAENETFLYWEVWLLPMNIVTFYICSVFLTTTDSCLPMTFENTLS